MDQLTHSSFAPHVGDVFRADIDSADGVELRLVEATALPLRGPGREPFSLVFRGPLEVPLPQGIYPLEHETLGRLELFLVPIGPDDEGLRLEAIFN